jgi:hypothetical protein
MSGVFALRRRARWPHPDFLARRAHAPWVAWALLGVGAACAALAVDDWLALRGAVEDARDRFALAVRREPRPTPAVPAAQAPDPGAAQAARRIAARLQHDWPRVLVTTEQAASDSVHWQRIEADADSRQVRLEGRAADRDAVARVVAHLQQAPSWHDVILTRLESDARGGAALWRFELRAQIDAAQIDAVSMDGSRERP